jgi:thymidylate synthase
MAGPFYSETTLDDLMRAVVGEILENGQEIEPSKGSAREITGVLLELTNPRARLSGTETRGKPFSCLGELCWYLAKSDKLEFIEYYIPEYEKYADGDKIFGGYGPRFFDWDGTDQVANVVSMLKRKRASRQAVIQLFDARDIIEEHKHIPCTCTLQFMIRRGQLLMFVCMRSNDAYRGLPHDIFAFTMLQELIARKLEVEIGSYKHTVGSLHLYEENFDSAKQFMNEGWQSTKTEMPDMPTGNPQPSLDLTLELEATIRIDGVCDPANLKRLDPYWADLVRLLQVYRCKKYSDSQTIDTIRMIRREMSFPVYYPFIDNVLAKLA